MHQHQLGKVYLVGAGVGDKRYLTLEAQEILSTAEVLVYDALVDLQLANLVPSSCLQVDVGKRGGKPSTPQAEINQILIQYCQGGKQVVRLKSGDPFVFGRANEEIKALRGASCPFHVIPGLSSALTAPLLAGIPLTDKHLGRSFAVLTGHQPDTYDWQGLAAVDTLVILMGGRNLGRIIQSLRQVEKAPTTPVAIIRDASRLQQQVWVGTLAEIERQTAGVSLSPTVMVIGEVVNLRTQPMRSMTLPLQGKTVLVTRSATQSSTFRDLLLSQGATVLEMPALEICPPSSWEELDSAIAHLHTYDWLILTSSNGVKYFLERLRQLGKDARALANLKIAVVGKKTASTLKQYNLRPDYIPPDFVADSLVEHFPESLSGKRVLFPRVETGGREVLVQELTAQGARMIEVPAYQSSCPETLSPQVWAALQGGQIDILTFASSKTVKNFYSLLRKSLTSPLGQNTTSIVNKVQPSVTQLLDSVQIASIGPQTSATCHDCFGRVDIEAKEYTLEGLTAAIVNLATAGKNPSPS
jgi:uroporphyrinogen III methyltransferase/synthase